MTQSLFFSANEMPHFVELYLGYLSRYFLIRQFHACFLYPAIDKRRPSIKDMRKHIVRSLSQGVENDTHRFFRGDLLIGAAIAFYEVIAAFFATIPLFPAHYAVPNDFLIFTILAFWHGNSPSLLPL
jgi:hypothetical protein